MHGMAHIIPARKYERGLTFKTFLHRTLLPASPSATYFARNDAIVGASSLPFREAAILQRNDSADPSSVTESVSLSTRPASCRHSEADRQCYICGSEPGPCSAGARKFSPLSRWGREMPSFFILWMSVVRFKPSLEAAPFWPPITQPTASRVCKIKLRSESLRVVVAGRDTMTL